MFEKFFLCLVVLYYLQMVQLLSNTSMCTGSQHICLLLLIIRSTDQIQEFLRITVNLHKLVFKAKLVTIRHFQHYNYQILLKFSEVLGNCSLRSEVNRPKKY